jgi:hypothetical protein
MSDSIEFRSQNSRALKLAAVEQHLGEAQEVGDRRNDSSAAGKERLRLADIAIRKRRRLRARHGNETIEFVLRHREAGVDHAERRE